MRAQWVMCGTFVIQLGVMCVLLKIATCSALIGSLGRLLRGGERQEEGEGDETEVGEEEKEEEEEEERKGVLHPYSGS